MNKKRLFTVILPISALNVLSFTAALTLSAPLSIIALAGSVLISTVVLVFLCRGALAETNGEQEKRKDGNQSENEPAAPDPAVSALSRYVQKSASWIRKNRDHFCIYAKRKNGKKSVNMPDLDLIHVSEIIEKIRFSKDDALVTDFIHAIEDAIPDAQESCAVNQNGKQDAIHERVFEIGFCNELVRSIIDVIHGHLVSSSGPLSEEIYFVKKLIYQFQSKIRDWKSDLTATGGKKNFEYVIGKYDHHNEGFKQIAETLKKSFDTIENNFKTLLEAVSQISGNSEQIQEISENINLLSINAAIESTKAGIYGRGFKVISREIERLSRDTNSFAQKIKGLTSNARKKAEDAVGGFNVEMETLLHRISGQRREFDDFYALLNAYYEDFKLLFSLVDEMSENIDLHIKKVNPVFQLQDIAVQQINNLKKIVDFNEAGCRKNGLLDYMFNTIDPEIKKQVLSKIIAEVGEIVTTESELGVLNEIAEKHKLDAWSMVQGGKSGELELF
ncbi:MAG: hypothetical protein JW969_12940 [Spirochaetales bacterium]|nr:hypothetical protein [Spirochaetales bacterium]